MEKQHYVAPEMEVIMLDLEDIITTSGIIIFPEDGGVELPDDDWN